jgi:ribose 5-phosphate isomerase A
VENQLKTIAANAVLPYLKPETQLGIGSGTTVDIFIDLLGKSGLSFSRIFTASRRSANRLELCGFKVISLSEIKNPLPIYVDGADEIDSSLCMIKGGGGALTLEKIIAETSTIFLCIVDESKYVKKLGNYPVPIEVIDEAIVPISWTIKNELGGRPVVRENFVSEHGHKILDIHNLHFDEPKAMEEKLNSIPGVITNGIFASRRANILLVGTSSGLKTFK